jgi:hypothetical protein
MGKLVWAKQSGQKSPLVALRRHSRSAVNLWVQAVSDISTRPTHVANRPLSDRFKVIGKPKSSAGERIVPFGKFVANTLKEWKLASAHSELVNMSKIKVRYEKRYPAVIKLSSC